MIQISNLTKKYGETVVFSNLNYTFENTCIYGLVGRNVARIMSDLSDTPLSCRIGTAKNFTLLLLLYLTQVKSQGMKLLMAGGGVALIGTTLVPLLSGLFG